MLDLGLEHLGIDVGKAAKGVQAIITEVGKGVLFDLTHSFSV